MSITIERRANWRGAGVVTCDLLLLISADGWEDRYGRCTLEPDHEGDHNIGATVAAWVWDEQQAVAYVVDKGGSSA